MASYWQSLKKPLTGSGLMNSKVYSTGTINKSVKSATSSGQAIHLSAKQNYPQAEPLPLPNNIDPSESMRFSPQRARDITSNAISTNIWNARSIDITIDSSRYSRYDVKSDADPHVASYDCTGAVSLNSSMQSNVPTPFTGMAPHYMHLNMPGGQWSQNGKWMSHDLHSSHYTNLRKEVRKNMLNGEKSEAREKGMVILNACLHGNQSSQPKSLWPQLTRTNLTKSSYACLSSINQTRLMFCHLNELPNQTHRMYSDKKELVKKDGEKDVTKKESESKESEVTESVSLSPRMKLKNAIRDYGSTVLVFHIGISLVSLGIFYQLVSSGLDVMAILEYLGYGSTISNNVASGASTFVVAYAIHKVFAPFRISITLVSAPFIVRYLRNKGILSVKPPRKP